eukprot:1181607-Prorocentrum_minimum.AAC.4
MLEQLGVQQRSGGVGLEGQAGGGPGVRSRRVVVLAARRRSAAAQSHSSHGALPRPPEGV